MQTRACRGERKGCWHTLPCPALRACAGRSCISGMCIYPEMGLQRDLVPFAGMSSAGTALGEGKACSGANAAIH